MELGRDSDTGGQVRPHAVCACVCLCADLAAASGACSHRAAHMSPRPGTCTPLSQVKYVVELAKALALHPSVFRVDLLTRLIK